MHQAVDQGGRAAEDAQYMYADRLEERVMDGRGGENVRGRERGSNGAAVQVRYPRAPVVQGSARGDPWAAEVPWNIHQHPRISHNR